MVRDFWDFAHSDRLHPAWGADHDLVGLAHAIPYTKCTKLETCAGYPFGGFIVDTLGYHARRIKP